MVERTTAPAEGERRAIRNLTAQYRVAAKLVRDALLDGELEWVRLVDPDAGRLDDVVIGRPGRVDAYQIKWSDYRSTITFRQLVAASKVSGKDYPAPFTLLADGWKSLCGKFHERVVRAHFLTHDGPSSSDGAKGEGAGEPVHLQGFLRNAWPSRGTWHQNGRDDFRVCWRLKIDAIGESSGLGGQELDTFLPLCELDLGFDIAETPGPRQARRERDVTDLANFLMDRVAAGSGPVQIDRAELLAGLRWRDRFELSFRHEFPVDERLYRPVEETVHAITRAVAERDRGYVALIGPPGSGKSTALTHTLRYAQGIRLVRYYAFVRDDARLGRGEAATFLHDLFVSLAPLAPREGRRRDGGLDLNELRERIGAILAELSENWSSSGVKTVILIDGLDHIAREQNPARSLIDELPHPSAIPAGVVIVLGTQRVGLEGQAANLRPIVAHLAQDERTIDMARLSRGSVRSIAEAVVDPALLHPKTHDRIERLSGGHPLALAYLTKRLATAPSDADIGAILDATVAYEGEIEADYRSYWAALRDEPAVRELLGSASRLRGALSLDSVEALASPTTLSRFAATAQQYFHQDNPNTWRFFHNSFRQFVIEATARNALNRPDPNASANFHRRLAEAGAGAPAGSQLEWERLYHLERAGQADELRAIDHQPFFRAQFLLGRPEPEIEEDIHRCMRAAAAAGDAFIVLGLMLAHKELGDRTSAFESINLPTLELKLRPAEERSQALISGPELLVPDEVALAWAARLHADGELTMANRVFDLAEPLDLLSGSTPLDATARDCDLDAWVCAAWRFRPLLDVVRAIGQVRVNTAMTDAAPPHEESAQANLFARRRLLNALALALLDADSGLLEDLLVLVGGMREADEISLRLDIARVNRSISGRDDTASGDDALARILGNMPPGGLESAEGARVADLICRLGVDPELADAYLPTADSALVTEELDTRDDDPFAPVETLFRQARARAARGRPFDPGTDIPDSPQPHGMGRVLFQRAAVRVANLWGEALAGGTVPTSEVVRRLGPVIRLYRRPFGETNRWLDWHYAQRASGKLFSLMLAAANAHGPEAFAATLAATMTDWTRRERGLTGWTLDARRDIAMAAFRIDGDASRTAGILEGLDSSVTIDFDLYDRVEQWRASVDAWLELGDRPRARCARDAMLKTSFGVYIDRDNQIEDWARLASDAILSGMDTDTIEQAGRLVVTILRVLNRNHRGGGRDDAVRIIITALCRLDPATALQQADWLLDGDGAQRADAMAGLAIGQLASVDADTVAGTLTMASRLMLPIDLHPSGALAKAIVAVANGDLAKNPHVAAALETTRLIVRTRVQDRSTFDALLGIERAAARTTATIKDGSLVRSDGTVRTQLQVERLAADPAALAATLQGATHDGMQWGRVIAAVPGTADRATFSAIGNLVVAAGADSGTLVEIVRRAASFRDVALVDAATAAALAASRPYGWLTRHDGGSRLAVARAFAIGDPEHGRRRALELLVEDHIAHPLPVRDLLSDLDAVLPTLTLHGAPARVWAELAKHIGATAEVIANPDTAPPFRDAAPLRPGELGAHLLLRDMDHPGNTLAWEARKGLISVIDEGDPKTFVRDGLDDALRGDLNRRTAALATIACLAWSKSKLDERLIEPVRGMAWDAQGVVRRLAQQILNDLGEVLPEGPSARELPPLYALHLPDAPMRERRLRGSDAPRGVPLPDTEDSVDLSLLFHGELEIIEKVTGIAFTTLTRRHAQIMRTLAAPENWSAAAERRLTDHLEAIGLKMSIRRPRSLVAHHAFGTLVAELCDAGALEWPVEEFDDALLVTDPYIDTWDPRARPDWLSVPTGKDLGPYPREEWMTGVAAALPTTTIPGGGAVLAEWTSSVSLDSDREDEARASIVAHRQMTPREQMPSLSQIWRDSDNIGREYPMLYGRRDRPVVAVAGGPKFSNADFLALNPVLGRSLGWTSTDEAGLFRWVDDSGRTMAESIWWQDGNVLSNDHSGIDQAAHQGWLVIATPEGWRQMRPKIANLVVHRTAGRSMPDREAQDGERVAAAVDMQALPD